MNLKNNLDRELTHEEQLALKKCWEAIEEGFGIKLWGMFVNPDKFAQENPFSIVFTLDLKNKN